MSSRGDTLDGPGNDGRNDGGGESGAIHRMRRAIEAASRDSGSRAELEAAALALVAELKGANHPPEQMLLQIKQLLAEAGLRPSYATPNDPGTPTGLEASIYRDVIAWSIRHYYREL